MLSQVIWYTALMLECLLLVRGVQAKLLRAWPVFYGYIAYVLLQDFVRLAFFHWGTDETYRMAYWITEIVAILMGCLVVFEIYRLALADYPGAARMARNVVGLAFALALARAIVALSSISSIPMHLNDATMLHAERVMRAFQAFAIAALVALFLFYSIPFGRNLRGILIGYALFIAERVICLLFIPPKGHNFWFYAYSAAYALVLAVWLAHLWSHEPVPAPQRAVRLEQDYQILATATRRRLHQTRG